MDYYAYDVRGSVVQIISESDIKADYSYDAFGNVKEVDTGSGSYYGYNAEEVNAVTGLQYLRARYYDSSNGRFISPDTYLGDTENPLTQNRYAYVLNNPVSYTDPSGHFLGWIKNAAKSVGGAIVNGAKAVGGAIVNGAKAVGEAVANGVKWVGNTVKNVGKSVLSFGAKVFNKVTSFAKSVGSTIATTVQRGASYAYKKLGQVTQGAVRLYNNVKSAAGQVLSYTASKVDQARQAVQKFACGTAKYIGNAIKSVNWKKVGKVITIGAVAAGVVWDMVVNSTVAAKGFFDNIV